MFPPDVLSKLKVFAKEAKEEIAAGDPLAQKIYQSFSKFQKQYDAHQAWTEDSFC